MNSFKIFAAAFAVSCALPAAAVTVTTIAADFSLPVGGSNIVYANSDGIAGNEVFRWGIPAVTNGDQNGFVFSSAPVPVTVATGVQFSLGTFSYINQPNFGTALTSLQLALTASIGGSPTPVTFLFGLGVDETPNTTPCAYPSTTPCSDRVAVSALSGSGSFVSGGITYTLFIDGFRDGNGAFSTSFFGQEGGTTTATVIGRFATPTGVPEPTSWAMLIIGFGMVGGAMRRPRRVGVRFA